MKMPWEDKPLSAYLQTLVEKKSIPQNAAEVINRLPDWKDQREAVKKWSQRLLNPALEVTAEIENKKKGGLELVDFILFRNGIQANRSFYYLEESLEEYLDDLRSGLEQFLEENLCLVCGKSLGGVVHIDCKRFEDYRIGIICLSSGPLDEKLVPDQYVKLKEYQDYMKVLEAVKSSGFWKDGTPWNAPHTYTEIRKAAISQKNDESNGGVGS